MRVIVLGGGVSGLSRGVRLLEAGDLVDPWARELSPNTPLPSELARQPGTGVRCIPGLEPREQECILGAMAEEGVSLLERARQEAAHVGPIANPSITGSSDGT
ncbi:amino acid oxidase [Cystobacter fuscus]|uniref:Amino acid oxidase n=1 Tax=Cystobacter fuscus TaxID=43 RepID=A0A250JG94_9BACT|nr:hypothetical protein [Cystobacter fuscus]ATB42633.1 amino acid oxidase [Cystobacter fuscus]